MQWWSAGRGHGDTLPSVPVRGVSAWCGGADDHRPRVDGGASGSVAVDGITLTAPCVDGGEGRRRGARGACLRWATACGWARVQLCDENGADADVMVNRIRVHGAQVPACMSWASGTTMMEKAAETMMPSRTRGELPWAQRVAHGAGQIRATGCGAARRFGVVAEV